MVLRYTRSVKFEDSLKLCLQKQCISYSIHLGVYAMGKYLDKSDLRRMGYICTECGKVTHILKSCPRGCTKICEECLRKKGYSFVFCKKCGDMTLQTWKGTD